MLPAAFLVFQMKGRAGILVYRWKEAPRLCQQAAE